MFEGLFSKQRAEHEAAKMQEKVTSGEAANYDEAEEKVEADMKAREAAAQGERKYSVDERGVVLTDEERKQRIEEGPDSHANQR